MNNEVTNQQILEKIDERFNAVDVQFHLIDERFNGMDARLDRVDHRLDQVDGQLEKIDHRLDEHDMHFYRLDAQIKSISVKIEDLVLMTKIGFDDLTGRAMASPVQHRRFEQKLENHEKRIAVLEEKK